MYKCKKKDKLGLLNVRLVQNVVKGYAVGLVRFLNLCAQFSRSITNVGVLRLSKKKVVE